MVGVVRILCEKVQMQTKCLAAGRCFYRKILYNYLLYLYFNDIIIFKMRYYLHLKKGVKVNMNHVDRKKIGIEILFASMSPVTSQSNGLTAEETVERLCDQSHSVRVKFAQMINSGIKTITSDPSIDVESYLNEDIKKLAKNPVSPDYMERLLPFFEWLMEIQRQNSLEMDKSRYDLNDVASHMERNAGEFLRTYANISGQSISFARRGNSIIMQAQERLWGRASLVFPDVDMKFNGTFPLVGFLFWIEAERKNGRYTFSFIVDVEFGTTDNHKRSLQDRNWLKFTFECACPYMEFNALDYGKTLAEAGKCGHGFIDEWSGELVFKESIIGANSLSDKEKELLPMARIFKLAYQLADMKDGTQSAPHNDMRISDKVLDTLENRYKFDHLEKLFKSVGEDDLYNLLNEAMVAWSCSDFDETSKKIHEFSMLLRDKEKSDSVRPLYKKITQLMRECTAEFDGKSKLFATYPQAAQKMRDIIEPKLTLLGFEGEFPHYRRRRGKQGEYITVLSSDSSEHPVNGKMKYRFELSAAVKKLKVNDNGQYFAADMPFEETTAEDCRSVSMKGVKFAELGGMYDGIAAVMNMDVFEGINLDDEVEDNAAILNKFADVASDAMKGKKIPRWYRKMRKKSPVKLQHNVTFGNSMLKYMPLGLYLTLLLIVGYLVCDYMFIISNYIPQLTDNIAIAISLAVGMLVVILCSLCKVRSKKKRIWRY